MRLEKMASVFFIVLTTVAMNTANLLAADTLREAIVNGTTSGIVKIWYQTSDYDQNDNNLFDKENSFFNASLTLGYKTDTFSGFGAGVGFYAVDDLGAYDELANKSIHAVEHGETATWLGEAYITYQFGKSSLKTGRQNINSPFLNSDNWSLAPNNFEACLVKNGDIPNTTVTAGYVTKERWLKSEEFEDLAGDGVFMAGAVNQSLPHSTLAAWYYHVDESYGNDNAQFGYLEAKTKLSRLGLAAQYALIKTDASGAEDTNAFGVKGSFTLGGFELSAAFSTVDDGTLNLAKISDHGIKTPLYTATISGDGDIAGGVDTTSYKVCAAVKPLEGFKAIASYGYYDHGSEFTPCPDEESTSTEFVLEYTGTKHVTCFAAYIRSDHNVVGAWKGCDPDDKLNTIRLWAQYTF